MIGRLMIDRAKSIFVIFFLVTVSNTVFAKPFENLFPDSRTVYTSQAEHKDYRLPLGTLQKKNNGLWQAEREERLTGTLYRRTIEVDDAYSRQEVFNTLNNFFSTQQGRLLYSCSGLDCGSSAAWANEHFGIKQLYGLDRYQRYWVWELNDEQGTSFAVIYAVQRGNKRIYVQTDLLEVPQGNGKSIVSSPEAILSELENKRYFVVPGLSVSGTELRVDEAHIESIAAAMARDRQLELYLVGHDYQGNELKEQLARSLEHAGQLKALLQAAGVQPERLHAQGVGPLAPRGKIHGSARVELVVE